MTYEEAVQRIEQLESDKKILMNRCRVYTGRILCQACAFKEDCKIAHQRTKKNLNAKVRNRSNIFG